MSWPSFDRVARLELDLPLPIKLALLCCVGSNSSLLNSRWTVGWSRYPSFRLADSRDFTTRIIFFIAGLLFCASSASIIGSLTHPAGDRPSHPIWLTRIASMWNPSQNQPSELSLK